MNGLTRLFFVGIMCFCSANMLAGELLVVTEPKVADVLVANLTTGQEVKVGKSPFQMPLEEITKKYIQQDAFKLIIRKDGHYEKNYVIPALGDSDLQLQVNLELKNNLEEKREVDALIARLFEAQRLIRAGDYAGASQLLQELQKQHPDISVVEELKGSVSYLQKDLLKALSSYRKAVAINPYNQDALKLKMYLEKNLKTKQARP